MYKLLNFILVIMVTCACEAETLYKADDYRALISDKRAHRVGDIITVQVVENASASATSGSKTDKSNDAGIKFTSPNTNKNYGLNLNENFDGSGKVARTGKLLAQLSVEVKNIDKNGDLYISGNQDLEINDEKQSINLEGKVRPVDVDEKNTVLSSKIANARITYVGDGVLTDSQHKGWLSKIITFLGLL